MTLDEAVRLFESGFDRVTRSTKNIAPDRQTAHAVVLSCGMKPEAQHRLPKRFRSEEAAIAAWLKEAWFYARERGNVLCWRSRPRVEAPSHRTTGWAVRSRFSVYPEHRTSSISNA